MPSPVLLGLRDLHAPAEEDSAIAIVVVSDQLVIAEFDGHHNVTRRDVNGLLPSVNSAIYTLFYNECYKTVL